MRGIEVKAGSMKAVIDEKLDIVTHNLNSKKLYTETQDYDGVLEKVYIEEAIRYKFIAAGEHKGTLHLNHLMQHISKVRDGALLESLYTG